MLNMLLAFGLLGLVTPGKLGIMKKIAVFIVLYVLTLFSLLEHGRRWLRFRNAGCREP